jgi:hypothetical protein
MSPTILLWLTRSVILDVLTKLLPQAINITFSFTGVVRICDYIFNILKAVYLPSTYRQRLVMSHSLADVPKITVLYQALSSLSSQPNCAP